MSTNGNPSSYDLWIGVKGDKTIAGTDLHVFGIYNTGSIDDANWDHSGFAAGIKGSRETEVGRIGLQALYSSGDDDPTDNSSDEFRTIAQSGTDNFGSAGYWGYLGLTGPRGSSDVQDLGVSLQNRGLGLTTVQAYLENSLCDNVTGYLSGGWLASSEENPISGSDNMGVELLAEAKVDLGDGLALELGGAYLFTGGFYKATGGGTPEDIYELFSRLQLEF